MIVSKVLINNFLSIETADISLPSTGLILVDGWNEDRGCANGVGKTSIFTAITWCLFNDFPREISVSEIVRRGTKKCSVTVELESKGKKYTFTRSRPGDLVILDEESNKVSEKEAEKILDINYQQYLLVGYFAQSLGTRFLNLNDADRKNLMTKLIGADTFSLSKEKVDKDLKDLTQSISKVQSEISVFETRINTYSESMLDASGIQKLSESYESAKRNIEIVKKEIETLSAVEEPDVSKYKNLLDKLNDELENIISIKGSIRSLNQQLREASNQREPVETFDGVCPHCNSQLDIINEDFIIHDSDAFKKKLEAFKNRQKQTIDTLSSKIEELSIKVEKEQQLRETIEKCKLKISSEQADFVSTKEKIRDKKFELSSKQQDLASIAREIADQKALDEKIVDNRFKLSKLHDSKKDLESRALLLKSVSDVFSPTGVPAYVLDSLVDAFNEKVHNHVSTLWPGAVYELQTFRENKSGSVTAKMSDYLTINGDKVSLGSLSGGELNCLSTAIDLALLEVFEQYTGSFICPVILDEPFNNMDAVTRESVVELLQDLSSKRLIIVVDHSSECKSMFDKVVMVHKKNGISSVSW